MCRQYMANVKQERAGKALKRFDNRNKNKRDNFCYLKSKKETEKKAKVRDW